MRLARQKKGVSARITVAESTLDAINEYSQVVCGELPGAYSCGAHGMLHDEHESDSTLIDVGFDRKVVQASKPLSFE